MNTNELSRTCIGGRRAIYLCTECRNSAERCTQPECDCYVLHIYCHSPIIEISRLNKPSRQLCALENIQKTVTKLSQLEEIFKSKNVRRWYNTLGMSTQQIQVLNLLENKSVAVSGETMRMLLTQSTFQSLNELDFCLKENCRNIQRIIGTLDAAVNQLLQIRIDNLLPAAVITGTPASYDYLIQELETHQILREQFERTNKMLNQVATEKEVLQKDLLRYEEERYRERMQNQEKINAYKEIIDRLQRSLNNINNIGQPGEALKIIQKKQSAKQQKQIISKDQQNNLKPQQILRHNTVANPQQQQYQQPRPNSEAIRVKSALFTHTSSVIPTHIPLTTPKNRNNEYGQKPQANFQVVSATDSVSIAPKNTGNPTNESAQDIYRRQIGNISQHNAQSIPQYIPQQIAQSFQINQPNPNQPIRNRGVSVAGLSTNAPNSIRQNSNYP